MCRKRPFTTPADRRRPRLEGGHVVDIGAHPVVFGWVHLVAGVRCQAGVRRLLMRCWGSEGTLTSYRPLEDPNSAVELGRDFRC